MSEPRLVVPIDPAHKAAIAERARKAGLSLAEFVRQACDSYDPVAVSDEQMAEALLQVAVETLEETMARVDERIAETDRYIAEIKQLMAERNHGRV